MGLICRHQPTYTVAHIRSKTDVANSVTWQPVSIINSTSRSFAHPVKNQGATDPTAPTTIASPSSDWARASSGWTSMSDPLLDLLSCEAPLLFRSSCDCTPKQGADCSFPRRGGARDLVLTS